MHIREDSYRKVGQLPVMRGKPAVHVVSRSVRWLGPPCRRGCFTVLLQALKEMQEALDANEGDKKKVPTCCGARNAAVAAVQSQLPSFAA